MLPSPDLAPVYDRVTWVYVNRDFSGTPSDRAAERIMLRFGLSSYPHLLLVDPGDFTVLEEIGRSKPQLPSALQSQRQLAWTKAAVDRYQRAERKAIRLEQAQDASQALAALEDEDLVVRTRAVEIAAKKRPEALASRAARLLEDPSDVIRFQVLAVLAEHGNEKLARPIERLLTSPPSGSKNPNVLRSYAAAALAACGDARSIDALAGLATSGDANNILTAEAVKGLVGIGQRHPQTRSRVVALLVQAYPAPGRTGERLARRVHEGLAQLTGKKLPFPQPYDAAARERLQKSW